MIKLAEIKKQFSDKSLFVRALTHKSWINENPGQRTSNERLEFLGDAVLELVVSEHLFTNFPEYQEGNLTALRANLVNTTNLSSVAKKINLGEAIFLSKGEEDGGGRTNPSLLADTMEAVIGSIYIDQDLKSAASFISQTVLSNLEEKLKEPLKDAKSTLQEQVQAKKLGAPKYKVFSESGPDHKKTFVVHVLVNNQLKGEGHGKSKSEAEQQAASNALEKMSKDR